MTLAFMADDESIDESNPETARFHSIIEIAMAIAWKFRNVPGATLEELRAEARMAAWDAAQAFNPKDGRPFFPFARRVINNRLISLFRKEERLQQTVKFILDAPIGESSGETLVAQTAETATRNGVDLICLQEAKAFLAEAIEELPPRQRQVILAYMHGETGSNEARKMGITKQSVSVLRDRALQKLRQKLGEREIGGTIQLLVRGGLSTKDDAMYDPFLEPLDEQLSWPEEYLRETGDGFLAQTESPVSRPEELLERAAAKTLAELTHEDFFEALLPEI